MIIISLYCVGAIDGNHVVIEAPINAGSIFFNYKRTHYILLLAFYDSLYWFSLGDIGDIGHQSDGGVLTNSEFGYALK